MGVLHLWKQSLKMVTSQKKKKGLKMVNKLNTVSRKCLAHLYSFRLLDGQPYLSLFRYK